MPSSQCFRTLIVSSSPSRPHPVPPRPSQPASPRAQAVGDSEVAQLPPPGISESLGAAPTATFSRRRGRLPAASDAAVAAATSRSSGGATTTRMVVKEASSAPGSAARSTTPPATGGSAKPVAPFERSAATVWAASARKWYVAAARALARVEVSTVDAPCGQRRTVATVPPASARASSPAPGPPAVGTAGESAMSRWHAVRWTRRACQEKEGGRGEAKGLKGARERICFHQPRQYWRRGTRELSFVSRIVL